MNHLVTVPDDRTPAEYMADQEIFEQYATELRQVMKPKIRWRYHRERALWSWYAEDGDIAGFTLGNCEEMICHWLRPFWGIE